jgi:hypothetical protein
MGIRAKILKCVRVRVRVTFGSEKYPNGPELPEIEF